MTRGKTLSAVCGERWPRLLPVAWAAAYCGMLIPEFQKSEFFGLVRIVRGRKWVDRIELDAAINKEMGPGAAAEAAK